MKCPFCGSEHVQYVSHTTRTNFGGLQACCGFLLMGPLGLLCGLCGQSESTSEYWVCHDCGNTFPTFMGTWKMQRENNKEESRKQQEALLQKERDQYYSNKVYLSPLANAEGTYTEASEKPLFHKYKTVVYRDCRRIWVDDATDHNPDADLSFRRTIPVKW